MTNDEALALMLFNVSASLSRMEALIVALIERMNTMAKADNDLPDRERTGINPEDRRDWETIQHNENDSTERLAIVGGFLYRTTTEAGVALVFVPTGA